MNATKWTCTLTGPCENNPDCPRSDSVDGSCPDYEDFATMDDFIDSLQEIIDGPHIPHDDTVLPRGPVK